jgi:hypothetical protein
MTSPSKTNKILRNLQERNQTDLLAQTRQGNRNNEMVVGTRRWVLEAGENSWG